jgi:hypothetical protein
MPIFISSLLPHILMEYTYVSRGAILGIVSKYDFSYIYLLTKLPIINYPQYEDYHIA